MPPLCQLPSPQPPLRVLSDHDVGAVSPSVGKGVAAATLYMRSLVGLSNLITWVMC